MKYQIKENKLLKMCKSENYNYMFSKVTGTFARWGKTKEDDPEYSPLGPEIADIELSTICNGPNGIPCEFCYKGNTSNGKFMTFETYKEVFKRLGKNIQQVAFGIGNINYDNSLWDIMNYTRDNGVIPNITINGNVTEKELDKLANVCGAVAVSLYDKDMTYKCVEYLGKIVKNKTGTIRQINIHQLMAEETFNQCTDVISDSMTDIRLKDLNAIVFLHLKKKGCRNTYTYPSNETYKSIIDWSLGTNMPFGMDSCQCNKFLNIVKNHKNYEQFRTVSEPCESMLFSIYVNTDAKIFPCSFCDGENGWEKGLDILSYENIAELWNSDRVKKWRTKLLKNKRSCPVFKINNY